MSGLLFLTTEDFNIQKGTKGPILCHAIPGFSLILFYSTNCQHCKTLLPIFKGLPGSIGGCQFGVANIGAPNSKQIVEMSRQTISPIKFVPFILLYIDGKPFMSYKGPYDGKELIKFVLDVSNTVQKKQQFQKEVVKEDPEQEAIPAYTIGKPIIGSGKDMVCYLEWNTAYNKGAQK